MLIATPYRDLENRDRNSPKVISEIRKTYLNSAATNFLPKLSADLLVKCTTDATWYPRRVQVRNGQLQVFSPEERSISLLRLPLRHLSLQMGSLPHSLAICQGSNIILTLQTVNQRSFELWVKTLAIELIRQTPLDAIKYLDIFTLADCWRNGENYLTDWNFNSINSQEKNRVNYVKNETNFTKEVDRLPDWSPLKSDTDSKISFSEIVKQTDSPLINTEKFDSPEEMINTLLKKCQNVETYVPVKEKLFLFESLSKMGRKVRSVEDVSLNNRRSLAIRAKSCHDLSNLNTNIAVREICKYFENR